MGDVQVEHVEGVVDGLDLAHLDEPHLDILGCRHKYTVTMVLGLRQHLHHTTNTCITQPAPAAHNQHLHLTTNTCSTQPTPAAHNQHLHRTANIRIAQPTHCITQHNCSHNQYLCHAMATATAVTATAVTAKADLSLCK